MVWLHLVFGITYSVLELWRPYEAVDASVLANTLLYPVSVAAASSSVSSSYINGLPSIFFGPVKNVSVNLAYNPAGSGVISVTNSSNGVSITFPLPPNTLSNVSRIPVYGFPPYPPAPSYPEYGNPGYALPQESSYGTSYNSYGSGSQNNYNSDPYNKIPQIKYVYGPVNLQYQAPIFPALDYSARPYPLPVYETNFQKGEQYIVPAPEPYSKPYTNDAYQHPPPSYDRGTIYDTKYPQPPQITPYYPDIQAPAPYIAKGGYNTAYTPFAYVTPAYPWKNRTSYGPYPVSNTTLTPVTTNAASKAKVDSSVTIAAPTTTATTTTKAVITKESSTVNSSGVVNDPPPSSKIGSLNITEEEEPLDLGEIDGLNDTLSSNDTEDATATEETTFEPVEITLPPDTIVEITLPPEVTTKRPPVTTTTRTTTRSTTRAITTTARPITTKPAVFFKGAKFTLSTARPFTTRRLTFPTARRFLMQGKTLVQNSTVPVDSTSTIAKETALEQGDDISEIVVGEIPGDDPIVTEETTLEPTTTAAVTRRKKSNRRKKNTTPNREGEEDYPDDNDYDEVIEKPKRRRKHKRRRLVLISTAVDVDEGALTGFDYDDNNEDTPRRRQSRKRRTTTALPVDVDNAEDMPEDVPATVATSARPSVKHMRTFARKVTSTLPSAAAETSTMIPVTPSSTTITTAIASKAQQNTTIKRTGTTLQKAITEKAKPSLLHSTTSKSSSTTLVTSTMSTVSVPIAGTGVPLTTSGKTSMSAGPLGVVTEQFIATTSATASTLMITASLHSSTANVKPAEFTSNTAEGPSSTRIPEIQIVPIIFVTNAPSTSPQFLTTIANTTDSVVTSPASERLPPKSIEVLQESSEPVEAKPAVERPPLNPAYFGPSILIDKFNEPVRLNAPHRFVRPGDWGIQTNNNGGPRLFAL